MDKNTILGLLLMGAVILLFTHINQPSEEQLAQMEKERAERLADEASQSTAVDVLTIDSITSADRASIVAAVKSFGVADTTGRGYVLNAAGVMLTVSADSVIGGSVTVDGTAVAVADIVKNNQAAYSVGQLSKAVGKLKNALADVARYKGFARHLSGDSTTVMLENDVLALELSSKGGVIARARLKEYNKYDSTSVCPIAPECDSYSFTLTSASQRFETSEFFFTPVVESDTTVLMQLELGDGATWGIRYTLPEHGYLVKMDVVQQGMNNIIPTSVATMDFSWTQKMARNEAGRMFEERNSALYYMMVNGDVDNLSENSSGREELSQRVKWVGYKNQFFSAVIIPATNFAGAELESQTLESSDFLKLMTTHATMDYSSTQANPASFTLFIGPNSYPLLSDLEDTISPDENLHLTKLIPLGWALFRWINTWIVIPVFDFLGGFIASYGIIILLLTIFIKIILFPFTYKSYMSQAKMRVLSPEIKEINEKYPGQENAMRRQQETMALYNRAGASPFSGCLPMLLQLPILIAMFNFFPSAIELRGQSFLWADDLSAPDAIVSWTTQIPFISGTFGNHISLFCLLMTVVNIIYTRINMQNQPGGNSMPGMKWMMYLMPVMFLVFFNNYASGLSYYYFLSLLITIVQTYIFRKVVDEDKVRATMRAAAAKPKKKSGFMARLEEAQRRQQAMMREQEKQRAKRGGRR